MNTKVHLKIFIKSKFVFLFLLFFNPWLSSATQWVTQQPGFWNSGSTWVGGIAPDNFPNDTMHILHAVALNGNLYLGSECYFEIDSAGGICGHNTMLMPTGARLLKYGLLELDTLYIPGGTVQCYGPGNLTLTVYGLLSNGGSLTTQCNFQVGPWFECQLPEYGFLSLSEFTDRSFFPVVTPNPASTKIHLTLNEHPDPEDFLWLTDISGKTVYSTSLQDFKGTIEMESLPPSLYFLQVKIKNEYFSRKIILLE